MEKNTITNLVDALKAATEARAADVEIDFKAVNEALTIAVHEAVLESLVKLSLGRSEAFKSAVLEVLRSQTPGRM